MKVQELKISDIKIGDRFRKEIGNLEELAASIADKGVLQPVTVDDKLNLLAGERRLQACKLLGKETIPVIIRPFRSELDSREIELMENVHRKDMEWQERARLEKQIFELKSSQDKDWSRRRQAEIVGANKSTVDRRLQLAAAMETIPELIECKTEDQAWKALKRIEEAAAIHVLSQRSATKKVKSAAQWADNHYKVGDAFQGMKELNPGTMAFCEVDPPYGIELEKRKSRNVDPGVSRYTEVEAEKYPQFLEDMMTLCYRAMRDNSFCIWWYGMTWHECVRDTLRKVGFKVSDIPAIWYKGIQGQTASPDTMLGSCYEPFFVARKGSPKLVKPGHPNVFQFSPVPPSRKIHPTERPIELMTEILDTFCYPGSIVVVPFLGSGVTLRACYKKSLVGFGWDLDQVTKKKFLSKVTEDSLSEQDPNAFGQTMVPSIKEENADGPRDPEEEQDPTPAEDEEEWEGEVDDEEADEEELDERDLADALEQA
jgi:ParB/RepB/Spo0J family partition protein